MSYPTNSTSSTTPSSSHSNPTATGSFPPTLITPDPSPSIYVTDPIDPQQSNDRSDKLFTILITITCISLLGFGIGYLRLRQMRRVGRQQLAHTNLNSQQCETTTTATTATAPSTIIDLERSEMLSPHITIAPLPLYTAASPATTLIIPLVSVEGTYHNTSQSQVDTPPSYQEFLPSKDPINHEVNFK